MTPIYSQTANLDSHNAKCNEELREKMISQGKNPYLDKEGKEKNFPHSILPQDTNQSMFGIIERKAKATPAPGHVFKEIEKDGYEQMKKRYYPPDGRNKDELEERKYREVGFDAGKKFEPGIYPKKGVKDRETFCDEAIKLAKKVPGPGDHSPKLRHQMKMYYETTGPDTGKPSEKSRQDTWQRSVLGRIE